MKSLIPEEVQRAVTSLNKVMKAFSAEVGQRNGQDWWCIDKSDYETFHLSNTETGTESYRPGAIIEFKRYIVNNAYNTPLVLGEQLEEKATVVPNCLYQLLTELGAEFVKFPNEQSLYMIEIKDPKNIRAVPERCEYYLQNIATEKERLYEQGRYQAHRKPPTVQLELSAYLENLKIEINRKLENPGEYEYENKFLKQLKEIIEKINPDDKKQLAEYAKQLKDAIVDKDYRRPSSTLHEILRFAESILKADKPELGPNVDNEREFLILLKNKLGQRDMGFWQISSPESQIKSLLEPKFETIHLETCSSKKIHELVQEIERIATASIKAEAKNDDTKKNDLIDEIRRDLALLNPEHFEQKRRFV